MSSWYYTIKQIIRPLQWDAWCSMPREELEDKGSESETGREVDSWVDGLDQGKKRICEKTNLLMCYDEELPRELVFLISNLMTLLFKNEWIFEKDNDEWEHFNSQDKAMATL